MRPDRGQDTSCVATTERRSYDGPIEVGMVMVGLGNEGEPFRRDLVLGFHPFKEGMVIYEALPCKMRKRPGSGVGEIGLCPEVNMRFVMRPEEASQGEKESLTAREAELAVPCQEPERSALADGEGSAAAAVPREEYERVVGQRDKLFARLEADPDRAAIATLDGLRKLMPELLAEDVVQAEAILDWIGVAGDELSLAERVRILALELATKQGYSLDEAERLCPPAFQR